MGTGGLQNVLKELDADVGVGYVSHLKSADDSLVVLAALHCCTKSHRGPHWNLDGLQELDCARAMLSCATTDVSTEPGQSCLMSSRSRELLQKLTEHLKCLCVGRTTSIDFKNVVGSCLTCPLEFICRLHAVGLFCLEEYIALNSNNPQVIAHLSRGLLLACQYSSQHEAAKFTFAECMYLLVTVLYGKTGDGSSSKAVYRVCRAILESLLSKLLKANEEKQDMCCIDTLSPLLANSCLDFSAVHAFSHEMLSYMLTYNPVVKVTQAVHSHHKWTSGSCSPWLRRTLEKVMQVLKATEVRDVLKKALDKQEVNWYILLMVVSVYVTHHKKAPAIMKELTENLLEKAFESLTGEHLISAFLLARYVAQEASEYFPSYASWFENYFGFSGTTRAATARTFSFLIKFLSDLVPFEPAVYLKVHLQKPPYMSAKCRPLYLDYTALAKTRLQDLTESMQQGPLLNKGEQLEKVKMDVQKALDAYRSSGKVPKSVIEASIFKKPYYTQQLLPTLMDASNFPDQNETVLQLISELHGLGKIPGNLYQAFISRKSN